MTAPVIPGAEPASFTGDARGALVLHGFTGNPQSMRGLAQALADAGLTVELPLLPGHGTALEDMLPTRWEDWSGAAEAAYTELAARCDVLAVVGLSMGGTLAVWLAEHHPEIAALAVVNPLLAPPDPELVSAGKSMLDSGDEVAPGIGSDIAKEGATELAYEGFPLRAALSLFDGVQRGRGRARVGGLSGAALHQRPGPRRRPPLERPARGSGQGTGRAGGARAQLPRRHARLGQGRDRGAHGGVRHRRPDADGRERVPRTTKTTLSRADVVHVASLARLHLSDEEIELFTGQLRTVLEHAADVAALDLAHLEPSSHPIALENVLRHRRAPAEPGPRGGARRRAGGRGPPLPRAAHRRRGAVTGARWPWRRRSGPGSGRPVRWSTTRSPRWPSVTGSSTRS